MAERLEGSKVARVEKRKLAALRVACWLLRVNDVPRGRRHWWRLTWWLLETRYDTAERIGGRDFARTYDYIPF